MPYVERITKAGKTIEIERYFTSRWRKKGITRGDKVKPTKEEQKKVNTRKAERTLRLALAENFKDGDYHIDFGYIRKKGIPPRNRKQMRKDADVLLRELRKEYKKAGIEFRYIHVMEIGEKGSRHHHMVIPHFDTKIIQACWKKAYSENSKIHFHPLDTNGDYSKLASYLIKYTDRTIKTEGALMGKRWSCSKNLRKPKEHYRIIKADKYREEPKPRKGYYIVKDSVEVGVHSPEYYGYGFMRFRMVQLE